MRYFSHDIVLQEVPDEISLSFAISGCDVGCTGCHWSELSNDEELTYELFKFLVDEHKKYISCVLFFGGEWEEDELVRCLAYAKSIGLKTCLYTGRNKINSNITDNLDYIKTGPWIQNRGGLNSVNTNQIFLDLNSNKVLNHLFRNERGNSSNADRIN